MAKLVVAQQRAVAAVVLGVRNFCVQQPVAPLGAGVQAGAVLFATWAGGVGGVVLPMAQANLPMAGCPKAGGGTCAVHGSQGTCVVAAQQRVAEQVAVLPL